MPDGNLLGVIRDVSDRKRTAEELRLTHARLQHLLENSPAVIYALKLDDEKVIPYIVSENMNQLLGFEVAETLSQEWWIARLHPDDKDRALNSLSETIANGASHTEYRIRHKGGRYVWVEDNRRLVVDESGKPSEVVGVWMDITKRKKAELRLTLQHAVSATLAEGMSLERTQNRIIETLGKGLEWEMGEWWTLDKSAKVLRRSQVWHLPSTEFRDFITASEKMTFEKGEGLPGRVWASGRSEWCPDIAADPGFKRREQSGSLGLSGWVGFPIVLRDEVLGVIGFFCKEEQEPNEDLLSVLGSLGIQLAQYIDKQQLAEQVRQAQKMEAIGTLAGGVAHDFNNILTVISGYAELMKMMVADDPKLLDCVEAIGKAGSRATSLVHQILTFSRNEVSKREMLQLGPIVNEAIKFLKVSIPSSIEVVANLDAKTPTVLADSTQIHQVVMNLGTNAWHAMRDRPGRLEVKLENFEVDADLAGTQLHVRPGKFVRLSVSDTGKGMDRATLSRIFEPFFTTKGPSEGTGLGLSVVHGIMQSHDGAISVYSQPGEGTTFHLYFPAIGGEAMEPEGEAAIPLGGGRRVLFVDDEEPIVRLSEKMLTRLGYVVEASTHVKDALEIFRAKPDRFDLVITDMTMPLMSGLDFAQLLKQIRPDLPIILTTGYPGGLKIEEIKSMGIFELLPKPPSLRSLGMAAQRALA
jgi:PAS domain S-box-containing protein